MDILSERRMVENEAVFRQRNEQIQKGFDNIKEMEDEEGEVSADNHENLKVHFFCECADENCRERIIMQLGDYGKIHEKRDQFIVIPGHEVEDIEQVVFKNPKYNIVQKLLNPPEHADKLHVTEVENV